MHPMCRTSLGHRFCDRVCDTSEPDLFFEAEAKRYPCLIESSECVSPSLFPVEMGAEYRTQKAEPKNLPRDLGKDFRAGGGSPVIVHQWRPNTRKDRWRPKIFCFKSQVEKTQIFQPRPVFTPGTDLP